MNLKEKLPCLGNGVLIKPVVGYEGLYSVTNDGRVWSIPRVVMRRTGLSHTIHGKWKEPTSHSRGGYLAVQLHKDGHNKFRPIHKLVAEAFLGHCPKGMFVDHRDRNQLNNCASNLRYVSPSMNGHNTEKVKGFSWRPERNKWRAYIVVDRKQHSLGYFDTEEEARAAYISAKKLHGLFTP